jgi:hypothetical protein
MQDDFYVKYHRAYQQAEDVAKKLFARFMKDFEHGDGTQTVEDLREVAQTQSIVSLLFNRVGIPASTMQAIVPTSAMLWLEEVTLKQLLFFPLIMGKGEETLKMRRGIDLLPHSEEIVGAALFLAQQFTEANRQRDFNRVTAVFQGLLVATPQSEEDREKFS